MGDKSPKEKMKKKKQHDSQVQNQQKHKHEHQAKVHNINEARDGKNTNQPNTQDTDHFKKAS